MTDKEYIVCLNVYFITPRGVTAKNESEAKKKAKAEFNVLFSEFKKKLDDCADEEIGIDYIERAD